MRDVKVKRGLRQKEKAIHMLRLTHFFKFESMCGVKGGITFEDKKVTCIRCKNLLGNKKNARKTT